MQPPPPKRRKSRGAEPHVNGDAMDIDVNGYVNGNRDPTPSERASPIPPSPIRWRPATLEHGTSTGVQTEHQPFNPFGETAYIEIDDSVSTVVHTNWSPDDPNLLFTAGESICQLWSIPKVSSVTDSPTSIDLSADLGGDPREPYMVTATCWGPIEGELFLAIETASHGEARRLVLKVDTNAAATMLLATTSGTIIDLQCHPSGLCLLGHSVTHHGSRCLEIWPLAAPGHPIQPFLRHETDLDICDIAWVSDSVFIVCGHNFINRFAWSAERGIEQITQHYDQQENAHNVADYSWDIATSDTRQGAAAFASIYEGRLGVMQNDSRIETAAVPDCQITAVRFKPTSTLSSSPTLAASYTDGNVRLWSFIKTHQNDTDTSMNGDAAPERLLHCVRILPVGPDILPTALAFSLDGCFIAAASEHRVHIWAIDRGWPPKAIWTAAKERWKGSDGDEDAAGYAGLSWDAEGRRLALALHKQVCISDSTVFA